MKCPELLSGILLSLLIFGPPLVVGYIIGRQDGKLSERSLLGRSIVGTKVGECCKYKALDGKQVTVRVLSLKKDRAGIC